MEWEDVSSMVTEPSRHSPTKASIKVANTAKSAAMLRAKALGQSGLFESSEFGSDSVIASQASTLLMLCRV